MSIKYYSIFIKCLTSAGIAALLTACGGGDGGGDGSGDGVAPTGSLSLSLTDAPVDSADEVVVEFYGVELQHANGERITFEFTDCILDPEPCQIDLLKLTGGASDLILDNETIPSGQYNWLRLLVNADPYLRDSYIVVDGLEYELHIPSGNECGLKLNSGFVVPAGGMADLTIDFDLRKSIHESVGNSDYILRPSLRIVDNIEVGTLSGTIDNSFYENDTECTGAVYVFIDGTPDAPDDEDGDGGGPDPITSALVSNDGGVHNYKVAFLSEGDYQIAFTCDSIDDDPAIDYNRTAVGLLSEATVSFFSEARFSFLSEATVTVTAGANTNYDFPPVAP
jgi:hypothetical protein